MVSKLINIILEDSSSFHSNTDAPDFVSATAGFSGGHCWPCWWAHLRFFCRAVGRHRHAMLEGTPAGLLHEWENPSSGERLCRGLPNQPHFISTGSWAPTTYTALCLACQGTGMKETVPPLGASAGVVRQVSTPGLKGTSGGRRWETSPERLQRAADLQNRRLAPLFGGDGGFPEWHLWYDSNSSRGGKKEGRQTQHR